MFKAQKYQGLAQKRVKFKNSDIPDIELPHLVE